MSVTALIRFPNTVCFLNRSAQTMVARRQHAAIRPPPNVARAALRFGYSHHELAVSLHKPQAAPCARRCRRRASPAPSIEAVHLSAAVPYLRSRATDRRQTPPSPDDSSTRLVSASPPDGAAAPAPAGKSLSGPGRRAGRRATFGGGRRGPGCGRRTSGGGNGRRPAHASGCPPTPHGALRRRHGARARACSGASNPGRAPLSVPELQGLVVGPIQRPASGRPGSESV